MTQQRFGIFARVFPPGPPDRVATAVADAGYQLTQLNLGAIGLPKMPGAGGWPIEPGDIRKAFLGAGVACWGLSGTYNMAHPDASVRRTGTLEALDLIDRAPELGVVAVTLCTGSRDPERMWAFHPDNDTESAWSDMRAELDLLLPAARRAGVVLGVEPEHGNVVRDAARAARLLEELGADAGMVGIVLDATNLLVGLEPSTHDRTLRRAFEILAERIICLHAKDLVPWDETLRGRGVVDYAAVAEMTRAARLEVPVIVQDVRPAQARSALAYLRTRFG